MNTYQAKIDVKKLYSRFISGSSEVKNRGLQSTILFIAWIGAMGLNFLGSMLTTRILGPAAYGDYKFIQTIWALLVLFSTFGLIQSGSRVILMESDLLPIKEAVGSVLMLALIMGFLVGLVTVIIAYPIDNLFHTRVAQIMITLSPLIIGITLRDALLLILQSTNQISHLAAIEFFPSVFYVVGLYAISKIITMDSLITLAIQQVSFLIVVLVIIIMLKPRFVSFPHYFQKIKQENKKFGFPIYIGLIATYATSYINRLSISYWVDNSAIGFFSLASTIAEPMRLIPNAAAISSFRSFAGQGKISRNIFRFTIITSLLALPAAVLLIGPLLSRFYPEDFASVAPMARILSFGAIAYGLGDFYNRFLGAHGKGASLRNVAYLVGLVNIVGFMFFTPLLGINGAVYTSVVAGFADLAFMVIAYKKFLR